MRRNNKPPHPGSLRNGVGKTRPFAVHKKNKAGSKLERQVKEYRLDGSNR